MSHLGRHVGFLFLRSSVNMLTMSQTDGNTIPRRRGRPPRISRSSVVDAAIEVGLDDLSMDAVADRLGVTTPALYTHVRSRAELIQLAAADLLDDATRHLRTAPDWESWLRGWARLLNEQLGPVGGDVLGAIEGGIDLASLDAAARGVALLTGAGLTPVEAAHVLWLSARVAISAGSMPGSPVADVAARALDSTGARTGDAMPQAVAALKRASAEEAFGFELDLIVAGIRHRIGTNVGG
ncbi:MAG: TetR family transcriptional regulator [Acidimicrobiales bacterium]